MNLYNSPPGSVSLGGILIGLGILTWYGARWWYKGRPKGKGKKSGDGEAVETSTRDWKELLPLASGLVYGSAMVACVGGLIGWTAYYISNLNSGGGNTALAGTTGAQGRDMATNDITYLTDGGALIVAVALVALIALWKKIPKKKRIQLAAGVWAGVSLAYSSGLAGTLGRTISPLLNGAGDPFVGVL
ncbi:hypothetical protein FH609_004195 [Streptomyces sp. 3MP-14]|uniref:Uncharacterized protein n=1 Tax=Streptomyces mimosae TaxID=2586635 RepID=A0A5N6A4K6_9ACTN|nr:MULTISPECIES: hypothetical protein [Streptomyces]KAB8162933.1 hypothetical protein FH607_020055 [Streptomyces mimosae]KAB8179147.1 hypothetical protein FH609_004195 [Streptomyces sp. 3MP-14]